MTERELLKDKKRIVIKIGSSSLTHAETGDLNLAKIEKLVRVISDMRGMGKEVILVSSGAIATGRQTLGGKACIRAWRRKDPRPALRRFRRKPTDGGPGRCETCVLRGIFLREPAGTDARGLKRSVS